jgi:hypothetical protein
MKPSQEEALRDTAAILTFAVVFLVAVVVGALGANSLYVQIFRLDLDAKISAAHAVGLVVAMAASLVVCGILSHFAWLVLGRFVFRLSGSNVRKWCSLGPRIPILSRSTDRLLAVLYEEKA